MFEDVGRGRVEQRLYGWQVYTVSQDALQGSLRLGEGGGREGGRGREGAPRKRLVLIYLHLKVL